MALEEYREKVANLSVEEQKLRDLYLKQLANGELQGPATGYASLDKPWLSSYSDEQIMGDFPKCSVYDYLKSCIEKGNYWDLTAISFYGTKVTYRELITKIEETAKSLTALGLKQGDKISLCLPSCPESTYLFMAANMLGITCNIIDPRINKKRIRECLGSDTKALFSIDTFNRKIAPIGRKLGIKNSFNVKVSESLPKDLKKKYNLRFFYRIFLEMKSWKKFQKLAGKVSTVTPAFNENQPAAIVHTSGTTGVPKAAMLSNMNIISVAEGQKFSLPGIQPGDKFLQIMPPFLAYGLVCGMCASLASGLELEVIPKFDSSEFIDLVNKHKPNIIMGVPAFFEEFLKTDKIDDLSFVKYMIAGGDKMNVNSETLVNDFVLAHGAQNPMVKGYGMSEVSSAVAINNDNAENVIGSVGKPMVKNTMMIVDPDTKEETVYGAKGEIYIKSPSIMMGYVNNSVEEKKVKLVDQHGTVWVKSGDLGFIDSKGNVTISGRLKRMIVRPDGHNVFPSTIEDIITKHEAVESCVVVGTSSTETMNGRIPTACIVLKPEYADRREEVEKELIKMCSVQLPPRDVAQRYIYIDAIEFTSNGKIDYKKIEQIAEEKIQEETEKKVL